MTTAILCAALALTVGTNEFEGVWEGKLATEFVEKRRPGRGKHFGNEHTLTLRITREGNELRGEWSEDNGKRRIAIEGTIRRNKFHAMPTRVIDGEWNADVVRNLEIAGEVRKNKLTGLIYGVGAGRVRSGQFELRRKL